MSETHELREVPLATLRTLVDGETADVALYLPGTAEEGPPVLYRADGSGLTRPNFDRLSEAGVTHLMIRGDDLGRCEAALESRLENLLHDSDIRPDRKAACVQLVGTAVVHDLLSREETSRQIARASNLLDVVIDGVLSDPAVGVGLLNMSGHHRTTASHMFAVGTLAVLLGAEVFGPDQRALKELGLAGLLHDLGKIGIGSDLLNKPTPLSPEEIQLLRHHPIESIRLLGDDPAITSSVRRMILQHHERFDGRGYPLGLTGEEILTGSRVIAIVDCFHALVGRREYRGAMEPIEAKRLLRYQAGRQFDPALYALWDALFERCWQAGRKEALLSDRESDLGTSYHDDHRPVSGKAVARRSPRTLCRGRTAVRCFYAGRLCGVSDAPEAFVSSLHDLSRAGLCMVTEHPMYRGEVVHVLVETAGEKHWIRGVVRWCRKQPCDKRYKAGIQFARRIRSEEARQHVPVQGMSDPELFPAAGAAVA
ncbi:MAG: HD domain-containing phosphohydrolase [Phycisphaerae bacterium]